MSGIKLGGKIYRLGHPLSIFFAEMANVQAHLFCLPLNWGDFSPYEYAVQLLYYIEEIITSASPRDKEIFIQEISESMEKQEAFISESIDPKFRISSIEANKDFMVLHAAAVKLLSACIGAHDYIEIENKELSPNLLYILGKIAKVLEIFNSWLYAFVKVYSLNEDGKLLTEAKVVLWDLDKIKSLNV